MLRVSDSTDIRDEELNQDPLDYAETQSVRRSRHDSVISF